MTHVQLCTRAHIHTRQCITSSDQCRTRFRQIKTHRKFNFRSSDALFLALYVSYKLCDIHSVAVLNTSAFRLLMIETYVVPYSRRIIKYFSLLSTTIVMLPCTVFITCELLFGCFSVPCMFRRLLIFLKSKTKKKRFGMLLFIFVNDSFVVTLRFAFITTFTRACANFSHRRYQGYLFCIFDNNFCLFIH